MQSFVNLRSIRLLPQMRKKLPVFSEIYFFGSPQHDVGGCVYSFRKRSQIRTKRLGFEKEFPMKIAITTKVAALALSLALVPASMFAQEIQNRKTNQQDRIANGVASGQMTARETGHVERQEAGINREERGMRAQDNGHLTHQDRRVINHQQNQESRRIYRDKHNARVRG